jgi:hypothetical protein
MKDLDKFRKNIQEYEKIKKQFLKDEKINDSTFDSSTEALNQNILDDEEEEEHMDLDDDNIDDKYD